MEDTFTEIKRTKLITSLVELSSVVEYSNKPVSVSVYLSYRNAKVECSWLPSHNEVLSLTINGINIRSNVDEYQLLSIIKLKLKSEGYT